MFSEGQRLRAEFGADAVSDLSLGQPLEATPEVRQAFMRAAAEDFPGRHMYMPNSGYPDVRERTALDVDFPGVTARGITMTAGAAGAMALALHAFVDSGEEILAVTPYFAEFRLYAETLGSPFRAVPSRADLSLDLDSLEQALHAHTGAVILNSPCNPSGHSLSRQELSQLGELLRAHEQRYNSRPLLVIDEVYHRLLYSLVPRAEPFEYYENTVLARSFSKDLGLAGERIGYLVTHPAISSTETERALELCSRALGLVNAGATAQRALLQLSSWAVDITPYSERRERVLVGLESAGISAQAPDGGLYVWARSPRADTLAFVDSLARQRVLVTPGIAFGDETHFRICFSQPLAALERAAAIFASVAAESGVPAE